VRVTLFMQQQMDLAPHSAAAMTFIYAKLKAARASLELASNGEGKGSTDVKGLMSHDNFTDTNWRVIIL
jgi:hypothetical protein